MNYTDIYHRQRILHIKVEWAALIIAVVTIVGTMSSIFSYIAFALAVVVLFMLSDEDRLCLVTFMMPFASVFKSAPGAQSFFTYLLMAYVLYGAIREQRWRATFLVSFILLCIFSVLQMYTSMNVLKTIKFLFFVLFIYIAMGQLRISDCRKVFLFYALGIIISSIVATANIIPNLEAYIDETSLVGENEEATRFSGLYSDPNYYTVNLIMALCLVVVLNHKKQLGTKMSLVFAVPLVIFAVMTYSKSAFLMLLLPIVLLLYSRARQKNQMIFLVLVFAAIPVLFSVFAGKVEIFSIVLDRFGDGASADDVTTGRFSIWMTYLKQISAVSIHTFMGAGLGAEYIKGRAAHNTYIDLMYYLGIIGTTILFVTIANASKQIKTPRKRTLLNYSGWLCIFPTYFFLSELFYFDWPFHILMALLVYKTDMQITPAADIHGR